MRSRMIREGSLGLFIILGIILFTGVTVWLRRLDLGSKSYRFQLQFEDANAINEGAIVRFRGFDVGRIISVKPRADGVDMVVEITAEDLRIPRDVVIEANQSGLVGETSIDIIPKSQLSPEAAQMHPRDEDCDSNLIICHQDRVTGQIGISFVALLRTAIEFSELYSDPVFFQNLSSATASITTASESLNELSQELTVLSRTARTELKNISTKLATTADQFTTTAADVSQLSRNFNSIISDNKGNLQRTATNLADSSEKLNLILTQLEPTVAKFSTTFDSTDLAAIINNLEVLTANLKDFSTNINDPEKTLLLQQTLEAARSTFENAQKITADLDELTGDPAFRNNLLRLVDGLSNLVSSTEELERQIQTAQSQQTSPETFKTTVNTSTSQIQLLPLATPESAHSGYSFRK